MSYKAETMDAPCVVVKSVGFLALQTQEVAQEPDIPLAENQPGSQALNKSAEIGAPIPRSRYKAGTANIAFVYKAPSALSR